MTDHEERQSPHITVRIVYEDLDLIEIEAKVFSQGWSGVARAYTSPQVLHEQAIALEAWCSQPVGEISVDASGMEGVMLRFYAVDRVGHMVCHVQLATYSRGPHGRPEQVWQLAIEMPTELGLIEIFAHELRVLLETKHGHATLRGVI